MQRSLKLSGFDVDTDKLVVEFDVPAGAFTKVLEIAGAGEDSLDRVADIPLSQAAAREIARLLGKQIEMRGREFFLEVSARRAATAARAHA
ncbi:MAG TPA: hypothetical protein VHY79_12190 [Rhizomicrobium sp.]|jgi:hypothetical protein|nr:hypothetical protein [Rhizomicrobium sp.]